MTYGVLIAEAKRQLHAALAEPITLRDTEDAAAAGHARALLYRVTAGGIALHLDLPRSGPRHRFVDYHGDGVIAREATLLGHLREDLLAAARAAPYAGQPTRAGSGTAARLARAADTAGAAFDLLAGHLEPVDVPGVPSTSSLRRGATRITARDAVLLARTLARLDGRLERPLRALAGHASDEQTRRHLVAIADDCKRVTKQGVRQFASVIHDILRSSARRLADDLELAHPVIAWPPAQHTPAAAVDLVAGLRTATRRRPDRLSVLDLAAVASTGAAVCLFTAYASAAIGGPTGTALTAARHWRSAFQDLTPFTSRARGRQLVIHARRVRDWAEDIIRAGSRGELGQAPMFVPTIQAITTDLADVAYAVTRAIDTKIATGDLLLPFDPSTRGREHLFRAARPTEDPVLRLRQATAKAQRSSRELARAVYDIDPATHPYPTRARIAWRRPPPEPRADTGPTTPPPRWQARTTARRRPGQ